MTPAPPAAAVFDLYDTLVTVAPRARLEHQQALARHVGAPGDVFLRLWAACSEASNTGAIGPTTDRARWVLDRVPEHVPGWVPPAPLDRLAHDVAEAEHRFLSESVRPVDGIADLLAALRSAGVRTWLLSNCSRSVDHTLDASGLRPLLDGETLSCDVGLVKPDPAIFERALGDLALPAEEVAYVADGMVDELGAAGRAGMHPVRVTWSHDGGDAPEGTPSVATAGGLAHLLGIAHLLGLAHLPGIATR